MTAICIVQGHPHGGGRHLCHALAEAYRVGAEGAGHSVQTLDVAAMDVTMISDPAEFLRPPPAPILAAQEAVQAAGHLAVFYPLWLGTMPALVKAFFERLASNQFAIAPAEKGWPRKMLKGRSARVVVTMGMPATAYRLLFGAHGVKGFESGILGVAGFAPIHDTLLGGVDAASDQERASWLEQMRDLGRRAA